MAERRSWEFGPFRLHANGRVLFRGGRAIPLSPKAADTLLLLVQNAGEVVEKEVLLSQVWPDACVEEGSLTRAIFMLRKALEDGANGQEFIATIPKRGYRFSCPVKLLENAGAQPAGSSPSHSWRFAGVALTVISAVALFAYSVRTWHAQRPQEEPAGVRMIAVLPFQNLTGDPGQEFVADGLTEEMITQLGALDHERLGVIARTSAMAYKGSAKPVSQVGRELGVNYILEGSVRRWGKRIRVSAQLVQTRDQTHLWAHNYESDAENVLKLESDVAQSVAREISLAIAPALNSGAANDARVDPLVHELCLRGRYEWNKRTDAAIRQAIYFFQQAIGRDPTYAPGYAGLADAYAVLPYCSKSSAKDTAGTAKAAAEHALQLDESLAEPHTTLGLIECSYLNVDAAERQYRRALQLNPNYATAHHWHSFCLWAMNRRSEAVQEFERARHLDPLALIIYSDEARALTALGQTDRAISLLKTAIELDPNFADTHRALAIAYVQNGRIGQALAEARRGVELDPNDYEQATLGYIYGIAGKPALARAIIAQLTDRGRPVAVTPLDLAFVYAGLGEEDESLRMLQRAVRAGDRMALLGAEPMLDRIRPDPRFQKLLRSVSGNLPRQVVAPAS